MPRYRLTGHVLLVFLPVMLFASSVNGSMLRQDEQVLQPNVLVEGQITDATPAVSWTFYGWQNQVLSFLVQGDGALDPVLTLRDEDGQRIIGNDDYNYPASLDSLVEAVTIPANGTYEVIVSSYGNTRGLFSLTMIPGYGQYVLDERFVSEGSWELVADAEASLEILDGIASTQVAGVMSRAYLLDRDGPEVGEVYARLAVGSVSGNGGWVIGLAVRYQGDGDHYLLLLNAQGAWRFSVVVDGQERVLRDWVTNPAIPVGETEFSLAVLVVGQTYTPVYDGQQLGQIVDDTILDAGQVGIVTQAANAVGGLTRAEFDGLTLTVPLETDTGRVFPGEIAITANPRQVAAELARRHVIPAGGRLAWVIEDSFIEVVGAGVDRLPLVESNRYQDFVMGTQATLADDSSDGQVGCGLALDALSDATYTVAYADNRGGFGVAPRNGDTFEPGIVGTNDAWSITDGVTLVVVHVDGLVHFFANGVYGGSMSVADREMALGNAIINFDSVSSRCEFQNTWVWSLDPP